MSARAILIAGPTASGKSAWAVRLAERHDATVINADSMQVYRDLRVLTARPGPEDLARVPHALYGHVGGEDAYSVGRWVLEAQAAILDCRRQGRLPIIVGGTGLYFKALIEGLSPIPPVPPEVREHWREQARRLGAEALHAILSGRDPASAQRLRPSDPQRLTRALEVLDATGRGLSDWQREPGRPVIEAKSAMLFVVAAEPSLLRDRADARLDAMVAGGALDEVRQLVARGLSAELPVMRALGVPPLIAAIEGRLALADAVGQAKIDTRHYIKRQATWMRRNMMSWNHVFPQFMERNLLENFTFSRN